MNNENSQARVVSEQVVVRLHQIFDDLIVVKKQGGIDDNGIEQRFLTRSYAALSLLNKSDAKISDAALSITDGGSDDGIDAIYISEGLKRIYIVQSKWLSNTSKGIPLNEFTRFRDGIKRLLNLNWGSHNKDLHSHRPKVDALMRDIEADVVLVFAHNSEHELSDDIKLCVSELIDELNKFGDLATFEEFTLRDARETARSRTRPENISITLMMKNWGLISAPYKSVYGAVAAIDLVTAYENNRERLFAENLRYGIEKSEVNDGIRQTAREEPRNFWYFNNGVTAICDEISKQPIGGNNTDSGVFDIKKISVINGAQTISSLARAKSDGADIDDVIVHLRIISLSGTPENFSTDVTTANNTQNDLNPIDFVAADDNQDRIRREASQLGLNYVYRRGESDPNPVDGFTIREATVAAACASRDIRLAVSAKRYISGLWENTRKEPYTKLFNKLTSAEYLWTIVRIMRIVDRTLDTMSKDLEGRERLVAVHSNRFTLFIVLTEALDEFRDAKLDKNDRDRLTDKTMSIFSSVFKSVENRFPDAYPGNIFKNTERQVEIYSDISQNVATNG